MSINTFWAFILKGMGIILALLSFSVLSLSIMSLTKRNNEPLSIIAFNIILFLFYFGMIKILLFNTQWIIEKLKLDKGFKDERIDIHIGSNSYLRIIIILISGYLFVETLPIVCKNLLIIYIQKHFYAQEPSTGWLIFYSIKAVICFIILTNNKYLAKLIDKQKKSAETPDIQT